MPFKGLGCQLAPQPATFLIPKHLHADAGTVFCGIASNR